jgi:hypothetical protein
MNTDDVCRIPEFGTIQKVVFWIVAPLAVYWTLGWIHEFGHGIANVLTGGELGRFNTARSIFFISSIRYNIVPEIGWEPLFYAGGGIAAIGSAVLIAEWTAYQRDCDRRRRYHRWKLVGFTAIVYAWKDLAYVFLPMGLGFLGGGGDGVSLHRWFEEQGLAPTIEYPDATGLVDMFLPDVVVLNPAYLLFFGGAAFLLWYTYGWLRGTPMMCEVCRV